MRALIIGAGLAGATSARILAEQGYQVTVYESESEVGGMCRDKHDGDRYYQMFGPHIWHTSDDRIQDFVTRFSRFIPFRHKVRSIVGTKDGVKYAHFPITLKSIQDLGIEYKPSDNVLDKNLNFQEFLTQKIGLELYESFIHHYTKRQWGIEPKELSSSLADRITVKLDRSDTEFFDHERYVGTFEGGFTALIQRMLRHPNIVTVFEKVELYDISRLCRGDNYDKVVITSRLDEFIGSNTLKFRYVKFTEVKDNVMLELYKSKFKEVPFDILVLNNCSSRMITSRITDYSRFLQGTEVSIGTEEPNGRGEGVPCYPITVIPSEYVKYNEENESLKGIINDSLKGTEVHYVGRLASYRVS